MEIIKRGAEAILYIDNFEGQKVLVADDLIATGGTVLATIKLVELLGGQIVECAFLVELSDLKGREKLKNYNMFSLIEFEGE